MFCGLEKVSHAGKARVSGELWSDVVEVYLRDVLDDDEPVVQLVVVAFLDSRALPYANGRGDLATFDRLSKTLSELQF